MLIVVECVHVYDGAYMYMYHVCEHLFFYCASKQNVCLICLLFSNYKKTYSCTFWLVYLWQLKQHVRYDLHFGLCLQYLFFGWRSCHFQSIPRYCLVKPIEWFWTSPHSDLPNYPILRGIISLDVKIDWYKDSFYSIVVESFHALLRSSGNQVTKGSCPT